MGFTVVPRPGHYISFPLLMYIQVGDVPGEGQSSPDSEGREGGE